MSTEVKDGNSRSSLGNLWAALSGFLFSTPIRVLLTGVFVIILSIIFKPTPENAANPYDFTYWASALFKDFGIALFVVFGIALAVESPARKRMIEYNREITENALKSYLKTGIPPEWFEYLRRQVQQAVFIRHELTVTIKLSMHYKKAPDGRKEEYVKVVQENYYVLENTTDREQKYEIPVYIEKPLNPLLKNVVKCESIAVDGNAISKEQLLAADKNWPDPESGSMKLYKHRVDVPKNDKMRIKTISHTAKPVQGHFVWSSVHPASELTIICEPAQRIKAFISIMHPESLTEVVSETGKSFSQTVKSPIMPGTAVEIVWIPA